MPEISLPRDHMRAGESLVMMGRGFTPNRMAISHLLRPDGTEYNPIRLRINNAGELSHRIDSTMLDLGTFEIWVEDEPSHALSNRIRFTVE